MESTNDQAPNADRRALLKTLGAGALASGMADTGRAAAADQGKAPSSAKAPGGPYNILFILTDQERYFRPGELPRGKGQHARHHRAVAQVDVPIVGAADGEGGAG